MRNGFFIDAGASEAEEFLFGGLREPFMFFLRGARLPHVPHSLWRHAIIGQDDQRGQAGRAVEEGSR